MTMLHRARPGVFETEYIVTSRELVLAFEYLAGKVTYARALARLGDWRWSEADARAFMGSIRAANREAQG